VGTISLKEFTSSKCYPLAMQTYSVDPMTIKEKYGRWGKYIHTHIFANKASEKRGFKTNAKNKASGMIGQLAVHQLNVSLGIPMDSNKQICLVDYDENDGKILINNGIPIQTKTKNFYKIFSPDCSVMIPVDQYKKYDKNSIIFGCAFLPDLNMVSIIGYISFIEFDKKKVLKKEGDKLRDGFTVSGPPSYMIYYSDLHNSQREYSEFINNGGSNQ